MKNVTNMPKIIADTLAELNATAGLTGQKGVVKGVEYTYDGTKWIDIPVNLLVGKSSTPTIAPASGAGTNASATITGSNIAGTITFTTGLSLGTNADLFNVTLADNVSFPTMMIIQLNGIDPATLAIMSSIYQSVGSGSTATFKMKGAGLSVTTTYTFNYHIMGY